MTDFRMLFESAPGLNLVLDPSLQVVAVTDAYLKSVPARRQDLLGRGVHELFTNREEWRASIERVCANKLPDVMQIDRRGDRLWLPTNFPVLGQGGEVLFVIHQRVDVTEDERMRQQNRELLRSNRDLEEFASVASHDLQEPLRMITHFISLLDTRLKGALEPGAHDYLRYVVDGAQRMRALIRDLLDYARVMQNDRLPQPVDAAHALRLALDNLQLVIRESDVQVDYGELPQVLADLGQLTQVFQNLIENGIKYRRGRPPFIRVRVVRHPSEWEFTVEDNGIGIDSRFFESIFLIFHRLHRPQDYPGSGIGLAVCRKIVERFGGRIWVESIPLRGSIFHFTLPGEEGISRAL